MIIEPYDARHQKASEFDLQTFSNSFHLLLRFMILNVMRLMKLYISTPLWEATEQRIDFTFNQYISIENKLIMNQFCSAAGWNGENKSLVAYAWIQLQCFCLPIIRFQLKAFWAFNSIAFKIKLFKVEASNPFTLSLRSRIKLLLKLRLKNNYILNERTNGSVSQSFVIDNFIWLMRKLIRL